jgi:hypothetical protein
VKNEFPDSQSLPAHARLFASHAPSRLILLALAGALVWRVPQGQWQFRDLLGPAIILVLEPFTEWAVHIVLLHWKPRRILGRTVDPVVARIHRAHHAAPRNVKMVLLPTQVVAIMLPIAAVITVAFGQGRPSSYTTLVFAYFMLLMYEWTHFLIHSKYRPRHAYFRRLWRHHRNHHFRNERYWFGVTFDIGDRVLRTAPERDAVPVSPTARDLTAAWD